MATGNADWDSAAKFFWNTVIDKWSVSTQSEYEAKKQAMAEKEKAKLALEIITIDQIAPGEQQPETDHNFAGEKTSAGLNNSMHWRDAAGWFGYDLFDKKKEAVTLQITYFGLDRKRSFDIFLNDTKLETVTLNGDKGDAFFTVDYAIPDEIKKANTGVLKLKFVAALKSRAGGIYYIRLLK
jgi:uncharacterized protein